MGDIPIYKMVTHLLAYDEISRPNNKKNIGYLDSNGTNEKIKKNRVSIIK